MTLQPDIQVQRSNGRGKDGKVYYYIRPLAECFNRSRTASGWTYDKINEKIEKLVSKWYFPRIILYQIEGHIIGSNNKENALKEWWRVCDIDKINIPVEVTIIS